jgi:hypothetical protein
MSQATTAHQEDVEQTLMEVKEGIQDVHLYQHDQTEVLKRLEAVLLRIEATLATGKPSPVGAQ